MHTIDPNSPLDPTVTQILREVTRITRENSIECIIVGATARDILLTHVFKMDVQRATVDVDFAIAVATWQEFDLIREKLAQIPKIYLSEKIKHRLYLRHGALPDKSDHPIDLLPFGGVEDQEGRIYWPPDMTVMMNVTSYSEVLAAAVEVEIEPDLRIRVASLPGITVLKLFAWKDRGNENPKDAQDLRVIMKAYAEAGNWDLLYGKKIDLLESADDDPIMAGIRLLGQDVNKIINRQTHEKIMNLLNDQKSADKLVMDMLSRNKSSDALEEAEKILGYFRQGMQDNAEHK